MPESEPDWMIVPAGSHCSAEGYEPQPIATEAAYYRSFGIRDECYRYLRMIRAAGWLGRVVLVVLLPFAASMWLLADAAWKTRELQLKD
jgi:hypothetical protein